MYNIIILYCTIHFYKIILIHGFKVSNDKSYFYFIVYCSMRNAHTHTHIQFSLPCITPPSCVVVRKAICVLHRWAAAKFLHLRVCDVHWTAVRRRHLTNVKSRLLILCFYNDRRLRHEPAAISALQTFSAFLRVALLVLPRPFMPITQCEYADRGVFNFRLSFFDVLYST